MQGTTTIYKKNKFTGERILLLALQIILLCVIVAFIFGLCNNSNKSWPPIIYIVFVIFYLLYVIMELCSSTCEYLLHKKSSESMYQKMQKLFFTHPKISFTCNCFHEEWRFVGPPANQRRTKTRVNTYHETVDFPYYSSRDVSGLFLLDCAPEHVNGKAFIQLELIEEINFADSISYMDYDFFRNDFYRRNRPRDMFMDFTETRKIPGMDKYNLIKLGTNDPKYINIFMYVLLTIIPFVEFYKCYVDSTCIFQKFTIRKIISTRYDLNAVEKYQDFTPALNLYSQQYVYQPNDYNYLNQNYQVDLPTKEEIEKAEQYQNQVPDYKIQSYSYCNGDIKVGIVQDDPAYSSSKYNEWNNMPPACAALNNDCIKQYEVKYSNNDSQVLKPQ